MDRRPSEADGAFFGALLAADCCCFTPTTPPPMEALNVACVAVFCFRRSMLRPLGFFLLLTIAGLASLPTFCSRSRCAWPTMQLIRSLYVSASIINCSRWSRRYPRYSDACRCNRDSSVIIDFSFSLGNTRIVSRSISLASFLTLPAILGRYPLLIHSMLWQYRCQAPVPLQRSFDCHSQLRSCCHWMPRWRQIRMLIVRDLNWAAYLAVLRRSLQIHSCSLYPDNLNAVVCYIHCSLMTGLDNHCLIFWSLKLIVVSLLLSAHFHIEQRTSS